MNSPSTTYSYPTIGNRHEFCLFEKRSTKSTKTGPRREIKSLKQKPFIYLELSILLVASCLGVPCFPTVFWLIESLSPDLSQRPEPNNFRLGFLEKIYLVESPTDHLCFQCYFYNQENNIAK